MFTLHLQLIQTPGVQFSCAGTQQDSDDDDDDEDDDAPYTDTAAVFFLSNEQSCTSLSQSVSDPCGNDNRWTQGGNTH